MRKNPMLKRILSFGLAFALFASTPASVIADADVDNASAETVIVNTEESSSAVAEGESAGDVTVGDSSNQSAESGEVSVDASQTSSDGETPENAAETNPEAEVSNNPATEVSDETATDASQSNPETSVSGDNASTTDEKVNTEEARAGATAVDSSKSELDDADKSEKADTELTDEEAKKAEEEKLDDKEKKVEEDGIEYTYTSNKNGSHVKTWTDEDGIEHSEEENCQYGEDGICTLCGHEKEQVIVYTYTSNKNGTHIKSWEDKDGEKHEEEEKCDFDENGVCKLCGYDKTEEEEIVLTDENGLVKITAIKKVLGGAVKVTAEEITAESDESQYNEMADALDEETSEDVSVVDFVAYDINLYTEDGEVVEPTGEVKVEFTNLSVEGLDDEELTTEVYHYEDSSVNKMDDVDASSDTVEMTTDHFSTYIVAVSGSSNPLFTSEYLNILSFYLSGNKYKLQDWQSISSLPTTEYYYGYYVKIGNSYESTFYPLQVRVYVDSSSTPIETSGFAYNTENQDQWFRLSLKDDYLLEKVMAGYGNGKTGLKNVNPDGEGDYKVSLSDYCTSDNQNEVSKINYLDVYLKSNTNVEIKDTNLLSDGTLEATLNEEIASQYDGKTISYRWSKNVAEAGYEVCIGKEFENGDNSVEENKINIVLDKGTLTKSVSSVKYKVEAYYTDAEGEHLIGSSNEYSVKYYNELQNGSFETPVIGAASHQYSNEEYLENGGVWQTTGIKYFANEQKYHDIEILNTDKGNKRQNNQYYPDISLYFRWSNNPNATTFDYSLKNYLASAKDGKQFAEINCEAEGALYQDVLTVKGTELNYWLSHRARGVRRDKYDSPNPKEAPYNYNKENYNPIEEDIMYVVIMPVDVAKDITTQSKLEEFLQGKLPTKDGDVYNENGIYVKMLKDDDTAWHDSVGTYTPTSYATRFYFLAGKTANMSNDKTIGNFIDDVHFTQDLPPVVEGQFKLSISKTIYGLSDNQEVLNKLLNQLQFEITAVDENGKVVTSAPLNGSVINAKDMAQETGGAGLKLTWTSKDTDAKIGNNSYYYIVREKNAELNDATYTLSAKTRISKSENIEEKEFNKELYVKLLSKANATFYFTNTYSVKLAPDTINVLTDKKAYVKNFSERTYTVELGSLNYTIERKSAVEPLDVVILMDTSGSMKFPSDLEEVDINSLNDMNHSTIYYWIENTAEAKIHRVKYVDGKWYDKDAAYSDNGDAFSFKNRKYYVQKTGGETRKYYLTKAAKALIDNLPDDSNVSLVTFNKDAIVQEISGQEVISLDSTSRDSLKNKLDNLATDGGTNHTKALNSAYELLTKNSIYKESVHDKVVILVSDGCPNGTTKEDAVTAAGKIKALKLNNKAPEIYSIGIDLDISDYLKPAKDLLYGCATSKSYYYNSNAAYLDVVFQMIAARLTGATIRPTTGNVVDVVDARFDVYDDSNNKIEKNGTYTLGGKSANVVLNENGTATITWGSQALGTIDTENNEVDKWNSKFTIAAKDDFIGGNVVATNGSESGVYIGSDSEKFPQPTVNVKLLELAVDNFETTVLLNEQLDSASYIEKLLESYTGGILVEDENNNYQYSYGNTNDNVGYFTVVKNQVTDTVASKTGNNAYEYSITIKYVADSYEDRSQGRTEVMPDSTDMAKGYVLADDTVSYVHDTALIEATGKYNINVVDTGLYAIKVNSDEDTKLSGAEYAVYTDKECKKPYKFNNKNVVSTSNNNGELLISGLGIGTYYLKETKAPKAFALSEDVYKIVVSGTAKDGYSIKTTLNNNTVYDAEFSIFEDTKEGSYFYDGLKDAQGNKIEYTENTTSKLIANTTTVMPRSNGAEPNKISFNVKDMVAYTLPETGGSGVYVYTLGGILLMMAGALMLYKNNKKKNK